MVDPTRDKPCFDNYRMCRFYFIFTFGNFCRREKEKMRSLRGSDDDSVENKKKDVDEVESAGKEKADGEVLVVVVMLVDLQWRMQLTFFFKLCT